MFTLHHWADRKQGLSELLRVLRAGGHLVVVERTGGYGQDSNGPAVSEETIAHYVSKLSEIGFAAVKGLSQ
jgi:ubiquinone/menaquinone biosynthesis C-methylase UbiE